MQDCLYHHPVHKISFIAQDMTDTRAFGYIYGSPENGHRFFGIKTEKAAGSVVVAMRDLFQVVFELKKKEVDETRELLGHEKEVREREKKEDQKNKRIYVLYPREIKSSLASTDRAAMN